MIAILSALVGFLSSALPEFFKIFRDGRDRAHEITLLKLQMEYARAKVSADRDVSLAEQTRQLEALALQRDAAEMTAVGARLKESLVGIGWVDALAGTVRPVLTYGFCLIYALVKLAQYEMLKAQTLPWREHLAAQEALTLLWSEDDMALFTAVVAFWFGQRLISKSKRGLV
jgi:hypothetical protein